MLSLNDIDLLVDPKGEAGDFIRKYAPTDLYYPWRRASFPGFGTAGLTYPRHYYPEPPFRVNRLYWPCMWGCQRWAFMHCLAGSDQVAALQPYACAAGAYFPLDLKMGNPETGGETLEAVMYLLPPTPLSGLRGLTGPVQSLYLLTLVDVRYFLNFASTGDITSNLFPTPTAVVTWDELFGYLEGQAQAALPLSGITLDWDDIAAEYLNPSPQMFNIPYEPLPQVIDAVAFNVGHRIAANYDGTLVSQSYATALSYFEQDVAANPQRSILSGGFRFNTPL